MFYKLVNCGFHLFVDRSQHACDKKTRVYCNSIREMKYEFIIVLDRHPEISHRSRLTHFKIN